MILTRANRIPPNRLVSFLDINNPSFPQNIIIDRYYSTILSFTQIDGNKVVPERRIELRTY